MYHDVKKTTTNKKILSKITVETTHFFLHNWSGSLPKKQRIKYNKF